MFLIFRMGVSAFFVPGGGIDIGEESIGFRSFTVYFRQAEFIGYIDGLAIDAFASDDIYMLVVVATF